MSKHTDQYQYRSKHMSIWSDGHAYFVVCLYSFFYHDWQFIKAIWMLIKDLCVGYYDGCYQLGFWLYGLM